MSKETVVSYEIDMRDPKNAIRFVRDDLTRILTSPGATSTELGWKKIRFYEWCLAHPDGLNKFEAYIDAKRSEGNDHEAGFKAAGWEDKLS